MRQPNPRRTRRAPLHSNLHLLVYQAPGRFMSRAHFHLCASSRSCCTRLDIACRDLALRDLYSHPWPSPSPRYPRLFSQCLILHGLLVLMLVVWHVPDGSRRAFSFALSRPSRPLPFREIPAHQSARAVEHITIPANDKRNMTSAGGHGR